MKPDQNKVTRRPNVTTIKEAAARARAAGLPVAECALRRWIKTGEISARYAGRKALVFYPEIVAFLTGSAEDQQPAEAAAPIVPMRRFGSL